MKLTKMNGTSELTALISGSHLSFMSLNVCGVITEKVIIKTAVFLNIILFVS